MNNFKGYRCSLCGAEFLPGQVTYTCPHDGGNLDVVLDYARINQRYQVEDITSRSEPSLWRYSPLLPVQDPEAEATPLGLAGWTPVYSPPSLQRKLGLKQFWIKDDGRNPSASFKDRASAVVVARAMEQKVDVIITASTGNAGAALACMSAAVEQKAVILAPKTAPPAKVAQLLIFGAKVILVDGNYDMAFDLSIEAANEFGWYCRNTGYNPFTAEGKKTAAFEIWENVILNLEDQYSPLNIYVSVGDGNIISGIHKGFKDLVELGWLQQMPRLIGVQATGSAAIANSYAAGTEVITPVQATTLADSISVDLPRDGVRAVRAATQTNGYYLTVEDADILKAISELGKVGIFTEPAGATAYAGLIKALHDGKQNPEEPVLVLNTGSGLKDIKAAMEAAGKAAVIEPTLPALKKHLGV
ncbi:MAG TPA: threonine synthase [Longilinea sp.]|nr:threonine synthase [Longilinea sp.]